MLYILILVVYGSPAVTSAQYNNRQACEAAAAVVVKS